MHGLVALLEIQASRTGARTGPDGDPVLLADQNRTRWNRLLIRRGFAALDRASALGAAPGPYTLQAAIAACHARAVHYEDTDWATVATLYGRLAALAPSPVVELNRAVAVSMAEGPAAGLALVDALADRARAEGVPPAAERTRRPAGPLGSLHRGAGGVPPGGCPDPQRTGTGPATDPSGDGYGTGAGLTLGRA